jgi:hypothetical protein
MAAINWPAASRALFVYLAVRCRDVFGHVLQVSVAVGDVVNEKAEIGYLSEAGFTATHPKPQINRKAQWR